MTSTTARERQLDALYEAGFGGSAPVLVERRHPAARLPTYKTVGAACADAYACLPQGSVTIPPGQNRFIGFGIAVELPKGWEMQVRSRSGLALNNRVWVANSPGTVDCDYRGEIGAILFNGGTYDFTVSHGDRIAQLAIMPVYMAFYQLACGPLSDTDRGDNGFGHTGV